VREELADGLTGPARDSRLALVDDLFRRGCSADELRAAHAQGRLALLPLERVLRSEGDQTVADIAREFSVTIDDLQRTRVALGLPLDLEAHVYGEPLAQHASRLRGAQDAGVPVQALVDINRVIGRSMAAIAAAGRDVITATLDAEDADEHVQAMQVAAAVEQLLPLMRDVLLYAYDEHTREVVRNEQAGALTLAVGAPDVREVGIAFADLVGFTTLGGQLTAGDLSAVAGRLEALAADRLRPRVSLVKTIGDEVMLASSDAAALTGSVLALVAAADEPSNELPRLRAGLAFGPAVRRAADWYGAPVNLASRLTALAEPGSLLADAAFRDQAAGAAQWTTAGEREVRGVSGAVTTYAATTR
jgi:adenylate cyclase